MDVKQLISIPAYIARDIEVTSAITTHKEKTTGVHGVGASTVCSKTEADGKITTHTTPSAHHAKYTNAEAIAAAKTDPTLLNMWTLLETLSPSGVNTIDSSVLAAHDLWMIVLDVKFDTGIAGEERIDLRVNEDVNVNYDTRYVDNTAIIVETGQTLMRLGTGYRHAAIAMRFKAILYITGKDGIIVTGMVGNEWDVAYDSILNGRYTEPDIDLTRLTFLFNQAATGKIKIYYLDY